VNPDYLIVDTLVIELFAYRSGRFVVENISSEEKQTYFF
jgi:hypothetical protein